eukprot:12432151-Heterocapsa_arctica.AAC.1
MRADHPGARGPGAPLLRVSEAITRMSGWAWGEGCTHVLYTFTYGVATLAQGRTPPPTHAASSSAWAAAPEARAVVARAADDKDMIFGFQRCAMGC